MLIQISLRAPNGQSRIQIDDQSTLKDLIEIITKKTGLKGFSLKYGYPPKDLDITPSALEESIQNMKLRGETIVVVPLETRPSSPVSQPAPKSPSRQPETFAPKSVEPDETSVEWPERGGHLILRVMPDDNSCLFTAFGGAMKIDNPSRRLRDEVANYILDHPVEYNKAILGDPPLVYTNRMRQMDTWGGAIELSVLSKIYGVEIASIDVKTLRVDRFGEGNPNRVILVYSGIHYDRIAFCIDLSLPVEWDVTQWSSEDNEVIEKARGLCQRLQSMHYYTDTTDFVICCEECNWIGQGAKDAQKHMNETKHASFKEMSIQ